jgi:hypothetical protein
MKKSPPKEVTLPESRPTVKALHVQPTFDCPHCCQLMEDITDDGRLVCRACSRAYRAYIELREEGAP